MRIQLRGRAIPAELFQSKVAVASALIALFKEEGLFIPRSLSIWESTFIESEGGRLVKEEKEISGWGPAGIRSYVVDVINRIFPHPHKAAVLIEGIIGDIGVPARLVIYGVPSLSRIYGDIEFDVWPTSEVRSIAQLYYEHREFRERVNEIVSKIMGQITGRIKHVVIGDSPDAAWNVLEWAYFYSPDKKQLVISIFKTIRYLAEESRGEDLEELKHLANIIKPYKEELFATLLFEIKEFADKLDRMAKRSGVRIMLGKSITFISESPESPAVFFNMFKNEILMPLKKHLVDEERIKQILRQVITGQRTLI